MSCSNCHCGASQQEAALATLVAQLDFLEETIERWPNDETIILPSTRLVMRAYKHYKSLGERASCE